MKITMRAIGWSIKWCLLPFLFLMHASLAQSASVLRLTASNPANNAMNAARVDTVATLTFSTSLNPDSVSNSHVILRRGSIKETVVLTAATNQITVRATTELLPATTYTLTVNGVQGSGGEQLSGAVNIVFRTRDGAWQNAQAVITSNKELIGTQLAFNKHDGTGMAIWRQNPDSDHSGVFASRYVNGQWETPQLVVSTDLDIFDASVAVGPDGAAVAVWDEVLLGDASSHLKVWASEFAPDAGWAPPQMIDTTDSMGSQLPKAAILPNGKAVVVWNASVQGTSRILSNEYTAGSGWSIPKIIDAFSHRGSFDPEIAFDSKGNGYAVWSQLWQGKFTVWGNRYMVDRGWIAPQIIQSNKTTPASGPKIAFDDSGNAIAVWNEADGLYAARYIRDQGWNAETLVTHEETDIANLAVNGAGDAFVTWTEIKPVGEDSHGITKLRSTVWAARFTSLNGWESPVLLQFSTGADGVRPELAIDEAGNAIAVWSGYNGSFMRIYANRYVVGNGWVNRRVIDTTNLFGAYTFPHVAIDAAGNAIAVWEQQSQPGDINTDVWFNRFE